MLKITEDQVLNQSPDAASTKAAKGLVKVSKWPLLGFSSRAIWGHCQGSGKNPYKTVVDVKNWAYKCSCPSRKFPCKHALALLLLYANQNTAFSEVEDDKEADFVQEWLDKREANAAKKAEKAANPTAASLKAKAKREEQRKNNVSEGVANLKLFLEDFVRSGILDFPSRKAEFTKQAKRLVDAQAPTLSSFVANIDNNIDTTGYGATQIDVGTEQNVELWKIQALKAIAKAYLICESFEQLDNLEPDMQAEVRNQIGFTQAKESVMAGTALKDKWLVLYRERLNDAKLNVFYYALYGLESKQYCYLLYFMVDAGLIPGIAYSGDMYFYQGLGSFKRGLCENLEALSSSSFALLKDSDISPDFATALKAMAQTYAQNPFITKVPAVVPNLRFAFQKQEAYVVDATGHAIKLHHGTRVENNFLNSHLKNTSTDARSRILPLVCTTYRNPFTGVFYIEDDALVLKAVYTLDCYTAVNQDNNS